MSSLQNVHRKCLLRKNYAENLNSFAPKIILNFIFTSASLLILIFSHRSGPSQMCWSAALSCFTLGPSVPAMWPRKYSNRPKNSLKNMATLKLTKDTARPSAHELWRTLKKLCQFLNDWHVSSPLQLHLDRLIPRCVCSNPEYTREWSLNCSHEQYHQTLDSGVFLQQERSWKASRDYLTHTCRVVLVISKALCWFHPKRRNCCDCP